MIAGAHSLLYSKDREADRKFFKTVLEFPSIDLGEGWLLFALPPSELAVHPGSAIELLKNKGVTCANPVEAGRGISTSIRLPSGGEIGLYQRMYPTMIEAHST